MRRGRRLLVTGASGMLGYAVARAASADPGWEVWVTRYRRAPDPGWAACTLELDLARTDEAAVALRRLAPEAVVHCAAVADQAPCEAEPALARAVNTEAPRALAAVAAELGCRWVQVSTDLVFDGCHAPYGPAALPQPVLLYGELKAEAEAAVLAVHPEAAVLRPSLLTGDSPDGRRSPHERLLASLAAGERPKFFLDEWRQPCGVRQVARVLLALASRPELRGIWHWGGAEALSRADMAAGICRRFGVPPGAWEAVRAADDPRFAGRPRDLRLELGELPDLLRLQPQSWEEQLREMSPPPGWAGVRS